MGVVQKDALRTMIISYVGIVLGYFNKGYLFLIVLKTEQIGLVNLIYSIGMLFAQFANFGAIYTTWKFFPFFRNSEKKHHGFLPFILLIVLAGILACLAFVLLFRSQIEAMYLEKSPDFVTYYYWFIPIGISTVFYLVFEVYLRGIYKNIVSVFTYEIVLRIALTIILVIYSFELVDFPTFVALHSLVYLIPTLVLLVYMIRIGEFTIRLSSIQISKRFKRIIFKVSSYFYVNTLGLILVTSLDVVMLAQMDGLKSTGIFSTVMFFVTALQVPYKSILRISSPLVSEYWKQRKFQEMAELYVKVSSVCLTIGLGLFLLSWLNVDFLFSFLKPEFVSGIIVFLYLMIGKIFDMYTGINGPIFTMSKQYKYDVIFTVFLILMVYFMNRWLIPIWGMSGAAISTSTALIVVNIGRLIFVYLVFKMHPFRWNQLIITFLGLLTLGIGTFVQGFIEKGWISFLIESTLVVVFFVLPIYIFKIEPETVNYLKKIVGIVGKRLRK